MAIVADAKKIFDNQSVSAGTYSDSFYIVLAEQLTLIIETNVDAEIVLQAHDGFDWQNVDTIQTTGGVSVKKHYLSVWGSVARLLVNTDCTITAKYIVKR